MLSVPHNIVFPLRFVALTRADEQVIAKWRYAPPYDVYIWNTELDVLADLQTHHFAVYDETGALVAHRAFGHDGRVPGGDYSLDALDIGGGLRPDLTGRGYGRRVLIAALAFGSERYAPQAFRVTVATFNLRARKTCEDVGFVEVSRFRATHDERDYAILLANRPH